MSLVHEAKVIIRWQMRQENESDRLTNDKYELFDWKYVIFN